MMSPDFKDALQSRENDRRLFNALAGCVIVDSLNVCSLFANQKAWFACQQSSGDPCCPMDFFVATFLLIYMYKCV